MQKRHWLVLPKTSGQYLLLRREIKAGLVHDDIERRKYGTWQFRDSLWKRKCCHLYASLFLCTLFSSSFVNSNDAKIQMWQDINFPPDPMFIRHRYLRAFGVYLSAKSVGANIPTIAEGRAVGGAC